LGVDFLDAFEVVLDALCANPLQYPEVYQSVRRAILRRFPYEVFYMVDGQVVSILAVMHSRRNPESWQGRAR
jgi:plasmid stabilization system protein ParE